MRHLIGNEPRIGERIEIRSINSIAKRLYETNIGKPEIRHTSDDQRSSKASSSRLTMKADSPYSS